MDFYTPIVAIVIYLASLMAPEGTTEFTFSTDRELVVLKTEDGVEWNAAGESPVMIAFKDGYFIEMLPHQVEKMKEKMSDHIAIPVDLEKGEIHLKRAPVKIEFDQKDELIIFTITRAGQEASEIRMSWTK